MNLIPRNRPETLSPRPFFSEYVVASPGIPLSFCAAGGACRRNVKSARSEYGIGASNSSGLGSFTEEAAKWVPFHLGPQVFIVTGTHSLKSECESLLSPEYDVAAKAGTRKHLREVIILTKVGVGGKEIGYGGISNHTIDFPQLRIRLNKDAV